MNDQEQDFFDDGPPDDMDLPDVEKMIKNVQADVPPSDYNQHMLLSYLISNPAMWIKCAPIIKTDYFDREYKPVIKFIETHLKRYQDMPNGIQVHSATGVRLDAIDDAKKESNEAWVCDSVEEFCRTQAYKDHIIKASEVIEQDKSRTAIATLLKEATDIERISLHRNLGYEVHRDAAKILSESQHYDNITTGSVFLDRALSGGLNRPSFNMISCASGDGKSIFLKNMVVNAAERNENCIFYSLELAEPTIMKRFSAMMTGTAMDNIYGSLDTIAYSLNVRNKTDGNIWIVKFPMGGTTISQIAAHHMELTMEMRALHNNPDFCFGVVAIDYLDLMYPVEAIERSNLHLKDKYVSEEVNEWTHRNKLITWSASQQTKGAQDEVVARQSGVSGGTGKVWTCDNLLIGKRSEEDKEDERWWAHIEKNRDGAGTKRKVPFRWDSETQRMTDGNMDDFQDANPTMFGRARAKKENNASERITKDALVQEQGGVDIPSAKDKKAGRSDKATDTLNKLRQMQGARDD